VICMNKNQMLQRIDRGFTLIEVLVCIGIIALLSALLFPALSKARRSAVSTQCLSQMKQFNLGIQLYCDDHTDALPPNLDGRNIPLGNTWIEGWLGVSGPDCTNLNFLRNSLLWKYTQKEAIWKCPASGHVSTVGGSSAKVRTVSINGFMGTPVKSPEATTFRTRGDAVRISPDSLFTAIDEREDTINDGAFGLQWDFSLLKPQEWTLRDQPSFAHENGAVVSFLDGHVELHKWVALRSENLSRNDQSAPGSPDVRWMQTHATAR